MVNLALVSDEAQIATSHQRFVREASSAQALALGMIRRTQYWVFDPTDRSFSPSKFSGYSSMDFRIYARAKTDASVGEKFDGGLTQQAISAVLGAYQVDNELISELETWVESRFGAGALDGINRNKWRFVRLAAHRSGGLAALAGGWEGTDELAASLDELRRTPGRAAPILGESE